MQHFLLHSDVLATNRAVYDWGSGFNRNSAGGSRSNGAIDDRQSRLELINVFCYLSNEFVILKWKANMHHVTLGDGCGLIDIYAKRSIPALHNLQQRFADFADANDHHSL